MSVDSDPQRTGEVTRPSARAWIGVVLVVAGIALLWLGWYEVAGETVVARQLPFVASASVPGAALLVAGAVLIGSEISRRSSEQAERMMATLYRLLTEETVAGGTGAPGVEGFRADASVVAVAGGTRYHRRECPLIEGKPDIRTVDRQEVRRLAMQPCPVCSPTITDA